MSAHGTHEYDEDQVAKDGLVQRLLDYEDGLMDDEGDILGLFQDLVDTGLAWSLQGSYGRVAVALIEAGKIREAVE